MKKKYIIYVIMPICVIVFFAIKYLNGCDIVVLEKYNYIVQIFSFIILVITALIALCEYVLTSKQNKIENNKEFIQKALDLAGFYKDKIIPSVSAIKFVYKDAGIYDIIKKIDIEKMKEFDDKELKKNLEIDEIESIQKICKSKKFDESLVRGSRILKFGECATQEVISSEEGVEIKVDILALKQEYYTMLEKLLNDLEYFAMHFTYNVADESVVYQSLQKTYIDVIKFLYFDISRNNICGSDKLFTNAIELFNIWVRKRSIQEKNITDFSRKNVWKGRKLKM